MMRTILATLLLLSIGSPAAARTPHFEHPWRERVATARAEFERNPGAFPNLLQRVPPPSPPPSAVASPNERWEVDGLILSWECESSPESPDAWDRMWLDIIDAAWDGAHLYIYIHLGWGSDADDVDRCQEMLQVQTGREPAGATWFHEHADHRLDSIWLRDYGPFFVVDAEEAVRIVDAEYVRYNRYNDDAMPGHFASWWGVPLHDWDFATEGGNFLPNGHGICIVSDTILGLNPQYSIPDIEQLYDDYLGCSELIILPALDDVTGHVDMWITWLDPTTLIVGEYDPLDDAASHQLVETAIEQQLSGLVDPRTGVEIEIVRIPQPDNDGGSVWRNFTNGIWIDDTYIMPSYDGYYAEEGEAVAVLAAHGVNVVPVDADVVITSAGAFHCISKTIPDPTTVPVGDDDDTAMPDDDDTAMPDDDDTVTGADDDIRIVDEGGCQCVSTGTPAAPAIALLLILAGLRRIH